METLTPQLDENTIMLLFFVILIALFVQIALIILLWDKTSDLRNIRIENSALESEKRDLTQQVGELTQKLQSQRNATIAERKQHDHFRNLCEKYRLKQK